MSDPSDEAIPELLLSPPGKGSEQHHTPFKAREGEDGNVRKLELSGPSNEEEKKAEENVDQTPEKTVKESLGPSHPSWTTREKHAFILTKAAKVSKRETSAFCFLLFCYLLSLLKLLLLLFFFFFKKTKLLYSRYGDVQGDLGLVSLSALFTAIVSRVADLNDSIRCIETEHHKFVFLSKGEFYVIIIARTTESEQLLAMQCSYLYTQLISLLTGGINKELKKRPNRDIFHLVAGTEKYFDALIPAMDREPEYLLNAVHCLPLDPDVRSSIGSILNVQGVPELFYALIIARGRLINVVRPKAHALFPADLHLIFNFVRASSGGLRTSESWTPLCLPNFNDTGYLHAHIAFVDQEQICLLLLSTTGTPQAFYALQQCSASIHKQLEATGALDRIKHALLEGEYVLPSINSPNLLHFLYKSNATSQLTSPAFTPPYDNEAEQLRLFRLYQLVHQQLRQLPVPMNIFMHNTDSESVFVWTCQGFELFATFGPLTSKAEAIKTCNSLLRWIKENESRLFILSSPVRD